MQMQKKTLKQTFLHVKSNNTALQKQRAETFK